MTFENTSEAHLEQKAGVSYLSFPALSQFPFLKHGFSTRLGGVSSGILSTMNLCSDSGPYQDTAENVQENYRRMAEALDVEVHSMVISQQVHKTNIRRVTKEDCGKGLFLPRDYDEIDGLITNQPNITLVTKYADCVPLYFVDPVKKAIGLTHSGWRGTVAGIGRITVEEMRNAYDCRPEDIIAVIGPSICRNCFEIGEDVAMEFKKAFPQNIENILFSIEKPSDQATSDEITLPQNRKYLCDLWRANQSVLLQAGLQEEHIHISGVCTSCNSELLFSHRKTQGMRGSLAAFLSLCE
jgi:YfiH family protein